jgi:hypothetical protein
LSFDALLAIWKNAGLDPPLLKQTKILRESLKR